MSAASTYAAQAREALIDALDRSGHGGNPPELIDFYTLLVLTRGTECSLEDVHDAWAMWRLNTRPEHPDLVPFDQLTEDVKAWDEPYRAAIVVAAEEVARG